MDPKSLLQKQTDSYVEFKFALHRPVANLARQMYPGKSTLMVEAFKNATSAPYGYLLIDLKQEIDDKLRLRTGIFPGDVQYVYLRK